MRINNSSFEIVANAFKILEISQPISTNVSPEDELVLAWELMRDNDDWFCLVRDNEKIYGFLAFDDDIFNAPIKGKAGEVATPLNIKHIIPSTMSILDVIPIFLKQYFLFVLTGNNITHVVSFRDLDKLSVKICIFSLFLELEKKLIEVFDSTPEKYLGLLSKNRIEKARELCRMKNVRETPSNLLLSTTFIDKKTMLLNDPKLFQTLTHGNKEEWILFFDIVEKVRNKIAHSDSIIEILKTPEEFDSFIKDLQNKTNMVLNY